jgi:hypothetical protein
MKRLPWLLIVVMFAEIALDAAGAVGGLLNPGEQMLPPSLFRLALAVIFTVFAFRRRPWALIAMAILEGLTGLTCFVLAIIFFCMRTDLKLAAWICLAMGFIVAGVTFAFIRCAIQWSRQARLAEGLG